MKRLFLLAAALLLGLAAPPAHGVEVEATGLAAILSGNVGSARNQALQNALRSAVEQGVGVVLESRTEVKNMQVNVDEVFTSSKGVVTEYLVLDERRSTDGESYLVKIRADVSEKMIEDRLSALGILHKRMGNQRVMVLYQSDNPHAMSRSHGATASALQAIRDELNAAGFRVFNEAATEEVYQEIEVAGRVDRPVDDLIAMALDHRADVLLRFENIGGRRGKEGGAFSAAYSTIRLSVYDTVTGRQIADAMAEGKELLRGSPGPYDWEKGLSEAAVTAARKVSDEAIGEIARYYQQIGDQGRPIFMVFRGFDDAQKDVILDFLENTPGFKQLSELKNTVDYLEVELFSSEDPSRLRRYIQRGVQDKGITLRTQSAVRNRIVFNNPKQQQ